MRYSQYLLPTLRETPADAELASHRLMLEAGMIRKVASGIYEYLPLGSKVLNKIIQIVREEMNRSGGQEIRLPIMQPADLWRESGRWDDFGPEMFKLKDRKDQEFTLGPTHEEVITDLVRREIDSYNQLPILLYQINDKYRDEIRPRYGVMRSREFLMKDAYSFHVDQESLQESYDEMFDCYARIFDRCGLNWSAVEAPTGLMGGNYSEEFMALADAGGEEITFCTQCKYSSNVSIATFSVDDDPETAEDEMSQLEEVHTPDVETVEEVAEYLDVDEEAIAKTFVYRVEEGHVAVMVRGDHTLAENKLASSLDTTDLEKVTSRDKIRSLAGADFGSIGPVGLDIPVIADRDLRDVENFVVGANRDGYHLRNVNWSRDLPDAEFADLRKVQPGDLCPNCGNELNFRKGIEVGQLFQLGTKYSKSLEAYQQDEDGEQHPIIMGCYGIGVSRIISAIIEQNHDDNGIKWPLSVAPFQVEIILIEGEEEQPRQVAEELYQDLKGEELEVLLDDRDASPGVKFNDSDLIGIPVKIIIGPRGLSEDVVEIELRDGGKERIDLDRGLDRVTKQTLQILEELN